MKPVFFKKRVLIVGLGNPGIEYEKSRHNVGFRAIETLRPALENEREQDKFDGKMYLGKLYGRDVILLKPQTYMNASGRCVRAVAEYFKCREIYVIFDDVSLSPGVLRLRKNGSAGGHNGVKDIIEDLGNDAFIHVKVGVGDRPRREFDLADWVLSVPSGEDAEKIDAVIAGMPELFQAFLTEPFDRVQGKFSH